MFQRQATPEAVYPDLVRSLYGNLLRVCIMSVGYVVSFGALALETGNRVLAVFAALGVLASAARISVLMIDRVEARGAALSAQRARALETRAALTYYPFALLLGVSAAYVLHLPFVEYHALMMCLLVGYGAGVAAGMGLRPRIAVPCLIGAVAPGAVVCLLHGGVAYWATAGMTALLLFGGIKSVLEQADAMTAEITRRLTFETLARHDALTGLPNRLALREWYGNHLASGGAQRRLAVYCIDLDGFKPVNDTFGHVIGDALLKAISARLMQAVPHCDMIVRLGGDEFVVIQTRIRHAQDAANLAYSLRAVISEPLWLHEHEIGVSACIGYTLGSIDRMDLDELIHLADLALYDAKRKGNGVIEPAR
ncbi:MAG: diguanylate cyclase, partial [Nevskiaceae bacterium]|nr:diguanylate cyclase [Nevskiaceae bacterium]